MNNSPNKICFISAEKFTEIYEDRSGYPYYKGLIHGLIKGTLPEWKSKFESMLFWDFYCHMQKNVYFKNKDLQYALIKLMQEYYLSIHSYLELLETEYMRQSKRYFKDNKRYYDLNDFIKKSSPFTEEFIAEKMKVWKLSE